MPITTNSDSALKYFVGGITYDIFNIPPTQRSFPCEIGEVVFVAGYMAIETLRFVLKIK